MGYVKFVLHLSTKLDIMNTRFTLAPAWKPWAWFFLLLGLAGGYFSMDDSGPAFLERQVPDFFDSHLSSALANKEPGRWGWQWSDNNLSNELSFSLVLIGSLLLLAVRERDEDELIQRLRLESLLWATWVNALLLFLANWLLFDTDFFLVMICALFSFYLLFVLRFQWVLWRFRNQPYED